MELKIAAESSVVLGCVDVEVGIEVVEREDGERNKGLMGWKAEEVVEFELRGGEGGCVAVEEVVEEAEGPRVICA